MKRKLFSSLNVKRVLLTTAVIALPMATQQAIAQEPVIDSSAIMTAINQFKEAIEMYNEFTNMMFTAYDNTMRLVGMAMGDPSSLGYGFVDGA
jgi:hypothetical protein